MKKLVLLCLLFVTIFMSGKDSFAYTGEGFEGFTFPPAGWISENVLGSKTWLRSAQTSFIGDACAFYGLSTNRR